MQELQRPSGVELPVPQAQVTEQLQSLSSSRYWCMLIDSLFPFNDLMHEPRLLDLSSNLAFHGRI